MDARGRARRGVGGEAEVVLGVGVSCEDEAQDRQGQDKTASASGRQPLLIRFAALGLAPSMGIGVRFVGLVGTLADRHDTRQSPGRAALELEAGALQRASNQIRQQQQQQQQQ